MTPSDQSIATLRIQGDTLIPWQISRLLGCTPTYAQVKGETFHDPHTGIARVAHIGMWQVSTGSCAPKDLDGQITGILARLTDNLETWAAMGDCFEVDLYCGIFAHSRKSKLPLAPAVLAAVGQRGIKLQLDFYGHSRF
jgi:hypothetical protein